MNSGAPASVSSGGYDEHRAKTPPPDLPSILLDARIVWLGMPIVSAVSELIIAQLLYLQYKEPGKDIYMYINSTGTCRADGSVVGYETEATAIYDTMNYVSSDIATINVGVAIGNSCMILAAGAKGKRAMLPNATAMLHQPRIPATGSRQAIEIAIKNREVQAQKKRYVGHPVEAHRTLRGKVERRHAEAAVHAAKGRPGLRHRGFCRGEQARGEPDW